MIVLALAVFKFLPVAFQTALLFQCVQNRIERAFLQLKHMLAAQRDFLDDDVEIILNEGLETIETKIFSGGGLGTYITLNVPKTVKSIAPGAFNYGMKIITSLPYDEKWFA